MAGCDYIQILIHTSRFADPYHTYLSLAILAILPSEEVQAEEGGASWKLSPLDAVWNATEETARWAREHIPVKSA